MTFHRIDPRPLLTKSIDPHVLDQLRTASNTNPALFEERYMPLLERLAEFLQQLPLSKNSYSEPGGALRFAIVSALTTLRMTDSVMFVTSGGSEKRMELDPQYRIGAFAASLATVPILVHYNINITVGGEPWSYLSKQPNLYLRLGTNEPYQVTWKKINAKPSSALGTLILAQFFQSGRWENFDTDVLRDMCEAINPSGVQLAVETPLAKCVRVGHEKAKSIEEKSSAQIYRAPETSKTLAESVDAIGEMAVAMVPLPVEIKLVEQKAEPEEDLPNVVQGWVQHILSQPTIMKEIKFNDKGNAQVPASAFKGVGMQPRELVALMEKLHLVIHKADGWATLNSRLTTLLDPSGSLSTK